MISPDFCRIGAGTAATLPGKGRFLRRGMREPAKNRLVLRRPRGFSDVRSPAADALDVFFPSLRIDILSGTGGARWCFVPRSLVRLFPDDVFVARLHRLLFITHDGPLAWTQNCGSGWITVTSSRTCKQDTS